MEKLIPYLQPSAELALLLRLMQGEAELPEDVDMDRLTAMIRKNRLEPMAAERLSGVETLVIDNDEATLTTMRQISALGHLARLFAEQGIRALSVKGPALAMEIYGTPALRCYHDLDFLVERTQVDQAVELMLRDGWTWHERNIATTPKRRAESLRLQHHYLFMKGDLYVELHWRLLPWDSDVFEQLWAARRQVTLGGAQLATLSVVHQLHHLVYHDVRHGFHRMKWLADLVVLLPRHMGEMEQLWQSLAQCGQEVTLLLAWSLMLGLKDLDVPDVTIGNMSLRRTTDGVLIEWPEKDTAVLQQLQTLLDTLLPLMESQKNIEDTRPYQIYRKLLPEPAHQQGILRRMIWILRPRSVVWRWIDLPDRLYWLYWPLRPVEKLRRMLRRMLR